MRKLGWLLIFSICGKSSLAQVKSQPAFDAYQAVGFIAGKSPLSFTAQSVNGIRLRTWFIGVGFGIDAYAVSSLPIFLDVKKEFTIKNTGLFLYADAGTHFITKKKTNQLVFETEEGEKGRLYLEAGMGLKFKTSARTNIFCTLGNSFKSVVRIQTSLLPGDYSYKSTYDYSRMSLRVGFQF